MGEEEEEEEGVEGEGEQHSLEGHLLHLHPTTEV